METKRKILLVSRHGVKRGGKGEDKEFLTNKTIPVLYGKGREALHEFVDDQNVEKTGTILKYSNKIRTVNSGKAILAGAFNMPIPQSREDLGNLDFSGIDMEELQALGYTDVVFNMEALKKDGEAGYLTNWISDPHAESYDGKPVTSFNRVAQTSRKCLSNTLKDLLINDRDLVIMASHGGIVEAILASALIPRNMPSKMNMNDFGGLMNMEDNFAITLDESKGGIYTATLTRKGQDYKMDLANF